MKVGIEKIALYSSRFFLDVDDLAVARGGIRQYVRDELMCHERSVIPPYEDAVTLAVNAAKRLLSPEDARDVELVVVGTESAVDFGKPVATWVHRFCELPSSCRTLEVKHACYGGTGAFKLAASWVVAAARPGAKALVISSDYSRNFIDESWEYIGGGGAAAMLVSAEPRVLEIDLQRAGCFTQEISDTFRPTATSEVMNDSTSVYSYLDALEGAFDDYERQWGSLDYQRAFKKHIYHAPFPGMPRLAHRRLLARCGVEGKAAANRSFEETVAPSLRFARRLGSMYGSSNFVSLMGLLATADDVEPGDPISLFSYGSGCQGEFYGARIGEEARQQVRSLDLDGHLDARVRLDVAAYEANERTRDAVAERRDGSPLRDAPAEAYERAYAGRQLLVLDEVAGFQRRYTWS